MTLRILTWNLHGVPSFATARKTERLDNVADKVIEISPDIVCFQEVWMPWDFDRLERRLSKSYSPIYLPFPSTRPAGGLVIFVKSWNGWRAATTPRFSQYQQFAPRWKFWEGDGLGAKGFLTADLQRDALMVRIVTTHLQAQYDGNVYEAERAAQLDQLLKAAIDPGAPPTILTGDFNTAPGERVFSKIVQLGTDLTEKARLDCGHCGTSVEEGRPGDWIDYILARADRDRWDITAESHMIRNTSVDWPFSDHQGLWADVTIRQRGPASSR